MVVGMAEQGHELTFTGLVGAIGETHQRMVACAGRAVNINLTLGNWLIGYYIEEYERDGADRAQCGQGLMDELTAELKRDGFCECGRLELYRYRQVYLACPQIVGSVTLLWGDGTNGRPRATGTEAATAARIVGSGPPQFGVSGQELVERLSFTHLLELIKIEDPVKRTFYEVECIRGGWSVRERKRQVASLYCERSGLSGLSENREKLAELTGSTAEGSTAEGSTAEGSTAEGSTAEVRRAELANQDPFVFELLGLKPSDQDGWQDESERNTWDIVRLTV